MKLQLASHRASFAVAMAIVMLVAAPMAPIVRASSPVVLTADLDGKMIDLTTVGTLYCHDFDYPRIHCFQTADSLAAAIAPTLAAAGTDYVVVFDGTLYTGASMFVSQDYSALSLIGWNDRISSFKGSWSCVATPHHSVVGVSPSRPSTGNHTGRWGVAMGAADSAETVDSRLAECRRRGLRPVRTD